LTYSLYFYVTHNHCSVHHLWSINYVSSLNELSVLLVCPGELHWRSEQSRIGRKRSYRFCRVAQSGKHLLHECDCKFE
jgi:hypothetical protein